MGNLLRRNLGIWQGNMLSIKHWPGFPPPCRIGALSEPIVFQWDFIHHTYPINPRTNRWPQHARRSFHLHDFIYSRKCHAFEELGDPNRDMIFGLSYLVDSELSISGHIFLSFMAPPRCIGIFNWKIPSLAV